MTRPPDISIVVSTYNRAALLEPALRALLDDQVAGDVVYEVIFVDNNSSDSTRDVLESFAAEGDPRFRHLFEARQGVSNGRNAGIRASSAPIIAFTDDDIRVAPNWVATIKRLFDEHPEIDCVGGPVQPIWEVPPPRWLDTRHWSPIAVTDYGPGRFEIDADRPRVLLTSNLAFRRRVFSTIDGFSPEFPRGQDHELQLRYWLAGGRSLYASDLVVWTEVPAARMKKGYHRRWHTLNGRVCARMQLRERSAANGSVRRDPRLAHEVFRVPRFLFRELKNECREWIRALAEGNPAETFARELAARHLLAYIAERRRVSRSGRAGRHAAPAIPPPEREEAAEADAATTEGGAMTRPRLALANLIIFGLLAGSGYDIVTDQEHWPFSQYPMFSEIETAWTHRSVRLFGVTASGTEVPLLDHAEIAPFDQCRLGAAFKRLRSEARDEERLGAALRDCLERYRAGTHDGAARPALRAVRLYELGWTLERDAHNAHAPEERRLVAQYPTEQ